MILKVQEKKMTKGLQYIRKAAVAESTNVLIPINFRE